MSYVYLHNRIVTLDELSKSNVFTTVMDKNANRFVKLEDGKWTSESLDFFTSEEIFAKKVKYDSRQNKNFNLSFS